MCGRSRVSCQIVAMNRLPLLLRDELSPCCIGAAACGASFDGFTEPFRKIEVAASETGTVAQLLVHEGDRVTKGQALATLDNDVLEVSREIAAANAQAKGKLDSAVAERELRKTRLERLEPLRAEGHASQEEIDRARTDLAVAEANLQAAREQHQLDELERQEDRSHDRTPHASQSRSTATC